MNKRRVGVLGTKAGQGREGRKRLWDGCHCRVSGEKSRNGWGGEV